MTDPAAAFFRLTDALARLKDQAQSMPAQSRGLFRQNQALITERRSTNLLLSKKLSTLAQFTQESTRQSQQAVGDQIVQVEQCINTRARTTAAAVTSLDETQKQVFSLCDELSESLLEQEKALGDWNESEAEADHRRNEDYRQYYSILELSNQQIEEIEAGSDRSDVSFLAFYTIEAGLNREERNRRAVQLNQAGVLAYEQKKLQVAYVYFAQAFEHSPGNAAVGLNLIRVCLEMGKLSEANRVWEEIRGAAGPRVEMSYTEALLVLSRGEYETACDLFDQALSQEPLPGQAASIYLSWAEAHYQNGHPARAVQSWRKVLEFDSFNPVARNWLELIE